MANKKKDRNRKRRQEAEVTWAGMIQTVLLAAINKGQAIEVLIGLILLVTVVRLPSESLLEFWKLVVSGMEDASLAGWALGIIVAIGWFLHAKWQRRNLHGEIGRISDERSDLQKKLLGDGSVKTSK